MGISLIVSSLWIALVNAQESRGEIRGVVQTPEGLPISTAEIQVVGRTLLATSDSSGSFVLRGLDPGEYVVRIRRIGFKAQQFGAKLWKSGEVKEARIVLERGEYQLPEIVVAARLLKPIEYGWTTRYDDFFRRKQVGLGHYIMRNEIERRGAGRTPSLLAGVRGVKLRFRHLGYSGTEVIFTGCTRVSVWIDGNKQRYAAVPAAKLSGAGYHLKFRADTAAMATGEYLQQVLPSQIEVIEIHRGPAEMPAEFLDDSCAAIAIWTR